MGQMTFALLFGAEQPEGVDFWDESCAVELDKWRKKCRSDAAVPESPYQSTIQLLGFYVAAGASGRDGVPYLEGFAVDEVGTLYAKEIAAARERWERFAAWCKTKGHDLPAGKLYLTETEVG